MDTLVPGQMLGSYRIISQIGQGGMATVYKAYQASMDRNVAIKVLPSNLANSKEFAGRFQQEARIIANLEHPHILPVFDSGESDGVSYLIMRYLEAGTLSEKMEAGPLSWSEIDRIFIQLAEALSYAHSHGVVHRDLKPSNALIDSQGNLFLTDFGIAKLLEGSSNFTKTDTVMGTPAYISPEQAQGQVVDQRSDIYSLGIILYEMVTGRVPFIADTPLAVILKHVSAPLPLPSTIKPDIPPLIEQVILKALAKTPQDRFNTTDEFIAAWKRARSTSESTQIAPRDDTKTMPYPKTFDARTNSAPKVEKKTSRGWLVGCLAGICLLSVIGAVAFFTINPPNLGSSEDSFEIAIGDEISNGEPDEGAGLIEAAGSKDIYTFNAEPGEEIFVQVIEEPETAAGILFSMMDDQNSTIFSTCLACGDPGLITLERGGVYTVTIGNDNPDNAGSGAYRFKLWEVTPPEEFQISLDEAVSSDIPGAGAGFIESPGARDVYTFIVEEEEDFYFQVIESPENGTFIEWQLNDEAGNSLFDTCLQCDDPGLITLDAGTYTITVGGGVNDGIGTYAFKVLTAPPADVFEIEIGIYITPDQPGPGAGVIEELGARDRYVFTAEAGQSVTFSVFRAPETGDSLQWFLSDENGNILFDTCMDCGDPAPVVFDHSGTFTLTVHSDSASAVGEYEIYIYETNPDIPDWPLLQNGSEGPEVYALQYLLRNRGQDVPVTGSFDAATEQAVFNFQSEYGLTENGTVEGETWRALIAVLVLENGNENDAVFAVQYFLREKFGFDEVVIDGLYGDVTESAVHKFQDRYGLYNDGKVDPVESWPALISITP